MTVQITTKRLSFPRRWRLKSDQLNEFMAQLTTDLTNLAAESNGVESNRQNDLRRLLDDMTSIRGELEDLKHQISQRDRSNARFGFRIPHNISMYDSSKLSFLEAASANVRASVNTTYGQATVPVNGVENKFFTLDFRNLEVVPPSTLVTSVTGTFDKGDGNGTTDYEYGGTVTEGDPENAFNGKNSSVWVRHVAFPLDSDVDSVECELTVQVPTQSNVQANAIAVHPHPWGDVDITWLGTSADLTSSFTALPGFSEQLGSRNVRFLFPDQQVAQIKVRLRQRNWREENGQKIFRYGLEELGLQLIDWDKTYDNSQAVSRNHTLVSRVDAPESYLFSTLEGFWSSPDFTLENASSRHLHFRLCADANGDTVLWNSDSQALPQSMSSGLTLGREYSTLYLLTTLNWVGSSGGSSSPFQVGTSPYLNDMGLTYTVVPE